MMKMYKKIFLFLLPLLLICKLVGVYAAFTVNPVIIEDTVRPGHIKIDQLLIKNIDTNKTNDYKLSVIGEIANYTLLSNNEFELPGQTSKIIKVYFVIPDNTKEGTYTGYIKISEVNGTSSQVYVKINVNPWVFSTTKWIQVPSLLYIDAYQFNVSLTKDKNGVLINNVTLYRDEEKIFYNTIKIKVLDINREDNQVYLQIKAKIENPSVVVKQIKQKTKSEEGVNIEGNVELYPQQVTKRIQQGIKSSSIILYLYNGLSTSIKIERIDVSGDIFEFEDGTQEPVSSYKLATQNNILEPGDQIPIIVKLSATKIDPGRYTVAVTVTYRVGNKLRYKTAILNIIVFKSQYQAISEVLVNMPDNIQLNKYFTIKVTGVSRNYDISVDFSNKSCVVGSEEYSNNEYIYKGKVTCNNINKIIVTVNIKREGYLIKSISREYFITKPKESKLALKPLFIKIEPPMPKPGDLVKVYAIDSSGTVLSDANILVNGLPMTSFIAEPKKTYKIEATLEGYRKAVRVIRIPGKKLKVIIVPSNPKVGDNITIEARDAKTNQMLDNVTIRVNGMKINGNVYHISKEGIYTITVSANGYDTITKVIHVVKPLVVNISKTKIEEGNYIYAEANKKVIWEVYYIDPKTNESVEVYTSPQPEQVLSYKPTKAGTYKIKAGNKEYFVTVTKAKMKITLGTLIEILFGFGILLLIIKILRKAKRRRKKSKSTKKTVETKPMFSHTLPKDFPAEPLTTEESKKVEDLEKGEQ